MKKEEYVNGLRELANEVEKLNFPDEWDGWWKAKKSFEAPSLFINTYNKKDFQYFIKALSNFDKKYSDYSATAEKQLACGGVIRISTDRENICKRIVTGTRTIPAKEEYTEIHEAEPEREEEIVKWECNSFLDDQN